MIDVNMLSYNTEFVMVQVLWRQHPLGEDSIEMSDIPFKAANPQVADFESPNRVIVRGPCIFLWRYKNISCVQVLVNIFLIVDVMESIENVSADKWQPTLSIEAGRSDPILKRTYTFLDNEVERISVFERLVDKGNMWMSKLLKNSKFMEPIFSYRLIWLFLWQKHFGDQIISPFVRTIKNITE